MSVQSAPHHDCEKRVEESQSQENPNKINGKNTKTPTCKCWFRLSYPLVVDMFWLVHRVPSLLEKMVVGGEPQVSPDLVLIPLRQCPPPYLRGVRSG